MLPMWGLCNATYLLHAVFTTSAGCCGCRITTKGTSIRGWWLATRLLCTARGITTPILLTARPAACPSPHPVIPLDLTPLTQASSPQFGVHTLTLLTDGQEGTLPCCTLVWLHVSDEIADLTWQTLVWSAAAAACLASLICRSLSHACTCAYFMKMPVCPTSFYPSCTRSRSPNPLRILPLSHATAGPCPGSVQASYLPYMTSTPFCCRGLESPGGAMSGLPAHAYDMYTMPPSPMTPMMRSHPGQQQRQQQLQQSTPPHHIRRDQLNSPGMHTLMSVQVLHFLC